MLAFINRHKKKFALTTVALGAGYMAVNYVKSKLSETRERMSSERIARENLKRRFEQNQEDCAFTIMALMPTATDQILAELPVESLTTELRRKKAEKKNKREAAAAAAAAMRSTGSEAGTDVGGTGGGGSGSVAGSDGREDEERRVVLGQDEGLSVTGRTEDDGQSLKSFVSDSAGVLVERTTKSRTELWEEIKISSLTRTITLIYTLSLLTLLTHIQLNLLGRRNYLHSVASLNTAPTGPGITLVDATASTASSPDPDPTHRQFLAFSYHLLNTGWRLLLPQIRKAIVDSLPYNPRDPLTFPQLHAILTDIRSRLPTPPLILPYLLPPRQDEPALLSAAGLPLPASQPTPPPPLRRLLDETSDILESPHCILVYTQLLSSALDVLERHAARELFAFDLSEQRELPDEARARETKVANVLAFMTREAHLVGAEGGAAEGQGGGGEYLRELEQCRELEGLSAVIYSEFLVGGEV